MTFISRVAARILCLAGLWVFSVPTPAEAAERQHEVLTVAACTAAGMVLGGGGLGGASMLILRDSGPTSWGAPLILGVPATWLGIVIGSAAGAHLGSVHIGRRPRSAAWTAASLGGIGGAVLIGGVLALNAPLIIAGGLAVGVGVPVVVGRTARNARPLEVAPTVSMAGGRYMLGIRGRF